MIDYLTLKTLHILSSVLMVGTGFGSAFYLFFANRSGCMNTQAHVSSLVCKADLWFTTPAVIFQPLSGIALAHMAGWSLSSSWILVSAGLYMIAGACWLPVVWLQIKMAKMAKEAVTSGAEKLPDLYWRYARIWEALGYPAFLAMMVVYFLMVEKPTLF